MVKLRLRVDDAVFDWLHAEAARLSVDVSTVVRWALRGERRDLAPAVPRVRKGKPGRRRRI
jgi:transposase